jgi:hypothetical protein
VAGTVSEESLPAAVEQTKRRIPRPPYRGRFLVVYAFLGAILAAGLAALVILLVNGSSSEPPWSSWAPSGSVDTQVEQIANHVAGQYRLPNGEELLAVEATPLRVQDTPVAGVVVRRPAGAVTGENPIEVFSSAGTIGYVLCGLGQNCSIASGKPSAARHRLVRREALELALYTFRYVKDAEAIVAFMPPPSGQQANEAILLRRSDLEPFLKRPLAGTLSPKTPQPDTIKKGEAKRIDQATMGNLFRYQYQQLQDGSAALILDDPRIPESPSATGQ